MVQDVKAWSSGMQGFQHSDVALKWMQWNTDDLSAWMSCWGFTLFMVWNRNQHCPPSSLCAAHSQSVQGRLLWPHNVSRAPAKWLHRNSTKRDWLFFFLWMSDMHGLWLCSMEWPDRTVHLPAGACLKGYHLDRIHPQMRRHWRLNRRARLGVLWVVLKRRFFGCAAWGVTLESGNWLAAPHLLAQICHLHRELWMLLHLTVQVCKLQLVIEQHLRSYYA